MATSAFEDVAIFLGFGESDYFTLSASSAPALNLMVLRAGMVMDSLVRGLMPVRIFCFVISCSFELINVSYSLYV